jgi:hypothetical protein
MPTHQTQVRNVGVRNLGRTGLTGFEALSGLEGWHTMRSVAGGLGSMETFAWRCTG